MTSTRTNGLSTLADRLRYRRVRKELTQAQLAEAAGMGQGTISDLENGKFTSMDGDTLIKASRALWCRPAWLLCGSGPEEEKLSQEQDELVTAWGRLPQKLRISLLNAIKGMGKSGGNASGEQQSEAG